MSFLTDNLVPVDVPSKYASIKGNDGKEYSAYWVMDHVHFRSEVESTTQADRKFDVGFSVQFDRMKHAYVFDTDGAWSILKDVPGVDGHCSTSYTSWQEAAKAAISLLCGATLSTDFRFCKDWELNTEDGYRGPRAILLRSDGQVVVDDKEETKGLMYPGRGVVTTANDSDLTSSLIKWISDSPRLPDPRLVPGSTIPTPVEALASQDKARSGETLEEDGVPVEETQPGETGAEGATVE